MPIPLSDPSINPYLSLSLASGLALRQYHTHVVVAGVVVITALLFELVLVAGFGLLATDLSQLCYDLFNFQVFPLVVRPRAGAINALMIGERFTGKEHTVTTFTW